jgi:hypothetical protein
MFPRVTVDRRRCWRLAATTGLGLIWLGIGLFVVALARGAWVAIVLPAGSVAAATLGWQFSRVGPMSIGWPRRAARLHKANIVVLYATSGVCSWAAISWLR